jgi:hypothetical protein
MARSDTKRGLCAAEIKGRENRDREVVQKAAVRETGIVSPLLHGACAGRQMVGRHLLCRLGLVHCLVMTFDRSLHLHFSNQVAI